MKTDDVDIVERLRDACVGQPAEIPWPHRLLHDAADEIASLRKQLAGLNDFRAQWQERTRGGYEYEIYAINRGGDYPVHGAYYSPNIKTWILCTWRDDGRYHRGRESDEDLLPVEKRDRVIYRYYSNILITEKPYTRREFDNDIGIDQFLCFLSDFEEWLKQGEK